MGLRQDQVRRAQYEGSRNERCVLWDDDPVGLGLRIFPSGRKAYVLSYRVLGRKRLMTIGDADAMALDAARRRARAELVAIENQNVDPLAEKRKRELEARTGTVTELFKTYLADTKPKTEAALLSLAEKHIYPTFGNRPWRDIRRSEVRAWHRSIAKPFVANRALQAFRAAVYWRLWQEDDSAGDGSKRDTRNPCAGINLHPEPPRQRRLELAELPTLEKAIDAETADPYLRAFFRFILATGCRRSEALNLKWADVQLDSKTPAVTFRDTKTGDDRTVPLSAAAVQLLKALEPVEHNPWVFIGHRHGTHLAEPNKAWDRIRKRAALPHLRIHDLRRSFGSWLGDAGFTSKQIGSVLGHRTDITSRVYMALGQQSARAAVDAVQALMASAGRPKGGRKVASLGKRRSA